MRALPLLAVLAWQCLQTPTACAMEPAFVVVTALGGTDHRVSKPMAARIFLRKQILWENGARAQPVNLPATHPLRRQFSQAMLGAPPDALDDYWRDMYFHGVLPPHVLASEEAVAIFVASTPGAIGYVSSCRVAQTLRIVLVVGDVPDCQK